MQTVPLGNTGIRVSALCLGATTFGTRNDEAASYSLLDQYVDAGGTFIDTANIYAWWVEGYRGGESEALLGQWLRNRRNRSHLFIASKVGFAPREADWGLRAWQIRAECEKSLQRMGIEMIDLYYAHLDDRSTPLEETLEAFDQLAREGKVRFIGASNFLAWRLEQACWVSRTHGWPEYCCIQQRYSYVRPKPGTTFDPQVAANDDLLDYCRAQGITLLAYSPLLSGVYVRTDRPWEPQYVGPDTDARLAVLRQVACEVGATPNQVVLAWMMGSDPPVIPLVAASQPEHMQEDLGALEVKLSAEQMVRLNAAGAP